jgi:hypothetical protein
MAHTPRYIVLDPDVRMVACGDCGGALPDTEGWRRAHNSWHRSFGFGGAAGDASATGPAYTVELGAPPVLPCSCGCLAPAGPCTCAQECPFATNHAAMVS